MIEMNFKTFNKKVLVFILSNLLPFLGLEVDTQQLNVPNKIITNVCLKSNVFQLLIYGKHRGVIKL